MSVCSYFYILFIKSYRESFKNSSLFWTHFQFYKSLICHVSAGGGFGTDVERKGGNWSELVRLQGMSLIHRVSAWELHHVQNNTIKKNAWTNQCMHHVNYCFFFFNACFNLGCYGGIQIRNLALMKVGEKGKLGSDGCGRDEQQVMARMM